MRLRLNADCEGYWGEQSASFQVRHRGEWSEIPTGDIHRVPDLPDSLDLDLTLPPGGREQDGTIFVSNYHWWPYTEMLDWLQAADAGTVRQLGSSFQGRAVYAVEFGEPRNPTMVHTQTPQPSEMGSLACRAMIDFLGSGSAAADAIVQRFHVCFIPMTNPDGTVLGYGVSDSQGRFPYFEGDQAALHSPEATPEIRNVWRYLEEKQSLAVLGVGTPTTGSGARATCCCATARSAWRTPHGGSCGATSMRGCWRYRIPITAIGPVIRRDCIRPPWASRR